MTAGASKLLVTRAYRVTVGFVADGERHALGAIDVTAEHEAAARERGIDELFDVRLRAAGCRAWASAERIERDRG